MTGSTDRFPLNAPGDFYVENGGCLSCEAPQTEAPELIAVAEGQPDDNYATHCDFRRQPETPEEVEHAIGAVYVACCDSVRYGGSDPMILDRLRQLKLRGWHEPDT